MECNNTRHKKGLHHSSIMFASLAAAKEAQGGPATGDDTHCLTSSSAPVIPQVPVTALLIQVRCKALRTDYSNPHDRCCGGVEGQQKIQGKKEIH